MYSKSIKSQTRVCCTTTSTEIFFHCCVFVLLLLKEVETRASCVLGGPHQHRAMCLHTCQEIQALVVTASALVSTRAWPHMVMDYENVFEVCLSCPQRQRRLCCGQLLSKRRMTWRGPAPGPTRQNHGGVSNAWDQHKQEGTGQHNEGLIYIYIYTSIHIHKCIYIYIYIYIQMRTERGVKEMPR